MFFLLFLLVFSSTLSLTIHNATCLDPRTINVDLTIRSRSSKFRVESLARHETNINNKDVNGENTSHNTKSIILNSLVQSRVTVKPTKETFNRMMGVITTLPVFSPTSTSTSSTASVLLNTRDGNKNKKDNLQEKGNVYRIEDSQNYQSRQNRLLLQEVQDGQKKITNLINDGDDDSWVPGVAAAIIILIVFSISVFACCIHCYPCCNQEMYIDST